MTSEAIKEEMQHVDGGWLRGGLDYGHYCRAVYHCETYTSVVQAEQLKPFWCKGQWLKCKYGGTWQMDSIRLPQTHQGKHHVLWWWEQPLDNWKHIPCPIHRPEHCPGPWKVSLTATWHPRKNWARQGDSFPKQPHRHLGRRAWRCVGLSHSLSYASLQENWMIEQTVTESNGWQDPQTVGYTFSKYHLGSQH